MPTVFHSGSVLTMTGTGAGRVDVVVIDDDRVVDVGGLGLLERYPQAERVDLAGRTACPGFIDAHNHVSVAAVHPRCADLSSVTAPSQGGDPAALSRLLRDAADREPEAGWVRAVQWEASGPLPLRREDLDEVVADRPVCVVHYSLHQCVVNSVGLDALGITASTSDPPGGRIDRDDSGHPTGLLREVAWGRAQAASLAPYTDPDRYDELLSRRMHELLAQGVTAVHDAACALAAEQAYRRLHAAGALPLSVLVMPHPAALLQGLAADRLDGPPTGEGDEWLRVGAMKLFADGGAEPWIEARRGGRTMRAGIPFPAVTEGVRTAADRGFRLAVHAMGNVGLRRALDAFEDVARHRAGDDHRFRLEHATLAGPDEVRRLAALDAVAVVQPGFVQTLGAAVAHVRLDDAVWMPFADLLASGLTIAGSSDDPCSPCEPLEASRAGATRRLADGEVLAGEQSVDYLQWLRAWTVGSAVAGGQEAERGALRPGLRADIVLLDGLDAVLAGDTDAPAPRVSETWVAGRRRYRREG